MLEMSHGWARRNAVLSVATAFLLASCASTAPTALREVTGPQVASRSEEHDGFLKVYSATLYASDDERAIVTYTDYQIDSADGSLFEQVINGTDAPRRVILPKGNYTVIAESENSGQVRVPVVISTGRLTDLHLGRAHDWNTAALQSADLVRLPGGQPIGNRAPDEQR